MYYTFYLRIVVRREMLLIVLFIVCMASGSLQKPAMLGQNNLGDCSLMPRIFPG
jgi:hypothetical protein